VTVRMSPTEARRAAYAHAKDMGCTCRPSIAYRPAGTIEVGHDNDCPMVTAGEMFAVLHGGIVPTTSDLAMAIDLACRSGVAVLSVAEAAIVVPHGVDVPPMLAEFADIVRLDVGDGRVVRICTLSDAVLAQMVGAS
jgi:hypothetical protein